MIVPVPEGQQTDRPGVLSSYFAQREGPGKEFVPYVWMMNRFLDRGERVPFNHSRRETYDILYLSKNQNMPSNPTKVYPLPSFHFQVNWGGTRIGFTEVSGLDFETEVIDYREGSSPNYHKMKLPGLTKYSNVTLKRGVIKGDYDFYKWWISTQMFQGLSAPFRRDVSIELLDEQHQPVLVWRLSNAWPTKLESSSLRAESSEVLIETLVLVHEGLSIDTSVG